MGILDAPNTPKDSTGRRLDGFPAPIDFRSRQALMPFRQAVTARDSTKCVWYALGDSITEGTSATARANRYVNRTLARLREVRPVSGIGSGGSLGSVPPYYDGTSMGAPYTSLTGTTPGKDTSFGLGRRTATMPAGSGPYTFTITGTSFDVFYAQGPTTGVLGVKIDGGAVVNVTTTGSPIADGKKWNSGALTAGTHTVEISQVSGGSVYFGGIYAYNGDETKGFHLLEAGHYGWRSDSWANSTGTWKSTIALHQPQLVTINLGTNDYQGNLSPATFKTNLQTLIADFRTNTTVKPSIVLMAMPERADIGSATYQWADYVNAMWSIAESDRGVAVFDASSWMISRRADSTNSYGLYADQVHPSNAGHALLGEALADWLLTA